MHTRRTALTAMAAGVCTPVALADVELPSIERSTLIARMAKQLLSESSVDSREILAQVAQIEFKDLNAMRADIEQRAQHAFSKNSDLGAVYKQLNAEDFRAGRFETLAGRPFSHTDLALLSNAL